MDLLQIALELWKVLLCMVARVLGVAGFFVATIATTGATTEDIVKGVGWGIALIVIAAVLGTIGKLIELALTKERNK